MLAPDLRLGIPALGREMVQERFREDSEGAEGSFVGALKSIKENRGKCNRVL